MRRIFLEAIKQIDNPYFVDFKITQVRNRTKKKKKRKKD